MANYEQLFLLEVLVDKVRLLTTALEAFAPETEDEPDTPVRIRVKFSDFPCFEITQDLMPPVKDRKDSNPLTTPITFSSGKSCLFPMDPEQLIQDLIKYPMAVTIFKKNPESPVPDIIGQTKVPLGDYMSNIIQRASEWALEEPLSEMIQDTFPLRNAQDQDVGTITMLIRLTCFGKTIITKFQIADNKKSFLFKNAKTQDYEFKCKKCMPGQPILRPRPNYVEEGEEEGEPEWETDGFCMDEKPLQCNDKEQMTDPYRDPCKTDRNPPRELSELNHQYPTVQPPGFQRHELQGPGFVGTLEVSYPEDYQGDYRQSVGKTGPTESHSAPNVKKVSSGKTKRGKSADPKKDIQNGVQLGTTRKKKKTKFHVPKGIAYPGIILGHKYCAAQGPPIPAKNGWAWKTTVPVGMKSEDMRGWRPGAYRKETWVTIQKMEELRKMGKPKKIKRKPLLPDTRKTTVHIHRIKGIYHVTMHPVKGPDDKEDPEPVVYTLENPEDGSDASEIEMDLTVPDPPYPPPPELRHQAQQFCEEDLPLIQPKPVFIKKKKKKGKSTAELSSAKKKRPGSAKSGKSDKKAPAPPVKKKPGKGKPDKKDDKKKGRVGRVVSGGKDSGKGGKPGSAKAGPSKESPGKKGGPPSKATTTGKSTSTVKNAPRPEGSGKVKRKGKGKAKGDDDDDVYPWDEWIMKLKCKNKQSPED